MTILNGNLKGKNLLEFIKPAKTLTTTGQGGWFHQARRSYCDFLYSLALIVVHGSSLLLCLCLHDIAFFLSVHQVEGFVLTVDDGVYLLPAMTYTITFAVSITIYLLRFALQWLSYRRRGGKVPVFPKFTLRDLPRISVVAFFIVLERILYRYTYEFALGVELSVLKVYQFKQKLTAGNSAFHVPSLFASYHGWIFWLLLASAWPCRRTNSGLPSGPSFDTSVRYGNTH